MHKLVALNATIVTRHLQGCFIVPGWHSVLIGQQSLTLPPPASGNNYSTSGPSEFASSRSPTLVQPRSVGLVKSGLFYFAECFQR